MASTWDFTYTCLCLRIFEVADTAGMLLSGTALALTVDMCTKFRVAANLEVLLIAGCLGCVAVVGDHSDLGSGLGSEECREEGGVEDHCDD